LQKTIIISTKTQSKSNDDYKWLSTNQFHVSESQQEEERERKGSQKLIAPRRKYQPEYIQIMLLIIPQSNILMRKRERKINWHGIISYTLDWNQFPFLCAEKRVVAVAVVTVVESHKEKYHILILSNVIPCSTTTRDR